MRKRGARAALSVLHLSRCPEHRSALSPILTSWIGCPSARLDFTKLAAPIHNERHISVLRRINNQLQRHLSRLVAGVRTGIQNKPDSVLSSGSGDHLSVSASATTRMSSRTRQDVGSNELLADSPELGEGVGLCRIAWEQRLVCFHQSRRPTVSPAHSGHW